MPLDVIAALTTAHQHLQEGALQAADDLITDTIARYSEQQQAAGLMEPPGPRSRQDILHDYIKCVSSHFGNPPDLEELIKEWQTLE
jgi:hypothetical protein